jgi:hypothetical protein
MKLTPLKPALKASQMQPADQAHLTHFVTVEPGTTIDDVLKPEFWRNVVLGLNPSDHIEVEATDGSFFADLRVRGKGKSWAKVRLHHVSHHEPDEDDSDAWKESYVVTTRPSQGFVILRKSDNVVVGKDYPAEIDAVFAARNLYRR